MNDRLKIDLKAHNGGSHLITNTFTVTVQVRRKNSTIISWMPGKPKKSRKKGSKQEYTEDVQAAQTNFSCFNFISKESYF